MLEKLVKRENTELMTTNSSSFSPLSNLRKSFRRLKAKRYRRTLSEGVPTDIKNDVSGPVNKQQESKSRKRNDGKRNDGKRTSNVDKHKNGKLKFNVVEWSSCESISETMKRKPGKHNSLRRSKASLLMPMSSDVNKNKIISPSKTKITRYNSIDVLNDSSMFQNRWCSTQDMANTNDCSELNDITNLNDKIKENKPKNTRRRKHSSSLPNISESKLERNNLDTLSKDVFDATPIEPKNEIIRKRQHRLSLQQEDLELYEKQANEIAEKVNEFCNVSLSKKKFHQSMFLSTISLSTRPPVPSVPKPIDKRDRHLKSASTEHLATKYSYKQSREFVEQYLVLSRKLKRSEGKSCRENIQTNSSREKNTTKNVENNTSIPECCEVLNTDTEHENKITETKWKSLLSSYQVPLAIAEALFDHTSLEKDELTFASGDVIKVLFMEDESWWWGCLKDHRNEEGWFPASYVRLRVVQEVDTDDSIEYPGNNQSDTNLSQKVSLMGLQSKSRDKVLTVRAKCVEELLNTEVEYVKMLKNIIEGYLHKVRVDSLFTEDDAEVMFSNIEELYKFHQEFLKELKAAINMASMETSCVGHIFLKNKSRFEIYSQYCNNQPWSSARLSLLSKNKKVDIFMESCRLRQNMIRLSLDGFLLSPVQRICKYPLQLKELLKHTLTDHPDYESLLSARSCMQDVASLINERKRRLENVRKLALWQHSVSNWKDGDLVLKSSDLIFRGDLYKMSHGKVLQRVVYLFDHQLVYFRKENIKRNTLAYKGRINLDDALIEMIDDDVISTDCDEPIKNAFKVWNNEKNKWYIFYTDESMKKEEWMKAFQKERQHVRDEEEKGFKVLHEFRITAIENAYNKQIGGTKRNRLRRKSIATNDFDLEMLLPQFTADGKIEQNYNFAKDAVVTKRTNKSSRTKSFRLSLTERTLTLNKN